MRTLIVATAVAAGLAGFAPLTGSAQQSTPSAPQTTPAPRKLELSFNGKGNVTLIAQGVTLQEILAQWTRLGGCHFPNADRLPRGLTMPLHYENMPELQVLDSLLRSAASILVSPRTTRTVGASSFEVVQILATSSATQTTAFSPSGPMPAPLQTAGSPDDELPPVTPVPNQQGPPRASDGQQPGRPATPTIGVPGQGVFVPIQPVTPATGRGGAGTTPPPPTTGSAGAGS